MSALLDCHIMNIYCIMRMWWHLEQSRLTLSSCAFVSPLPTNAFCSKGCILKDSGRNVSQSRRYMRAGVIFPLLSQFWRRTLTHKDVLSFLFSRPPFSAVTERLDQLGAVSHLITRCKWNGYTCLIFSGSRNVRLARDGIKQHCQHKWTQGFLSYFTSYWVTVRMYFTAVGRLVWKCSVMPLRIEGESRKKYEECFSHEAFVYFLALWQHLIVLTEPYYSSGSVFTL